MQGKSYWIWHWGDYEIFHTMNVHLKREERGFHRPPFWKISTPYVSVKFKKKVCSNGGYLFCHLNGIGYVAVDDMRCCANQRIELTPGEHNIEVHVSNFGGLPSIFVESDVCPSDGSWVCNHFAGEFSSVGFNEYFCRPDLNPERFPFEYQKILPENKEYVNGGILFDFGRELFGFTNILNAEESDKIGVFYGESREEALDTDYSYLIDCVSGQKNYRLSQRAFRYVYLKTSSKNIDVTVDYEFLPVDIKGEFSCDNELFNKIVKTATYTFHLNCREAYFDGIKRDRWVWSGDAYQSSRISRYLFDDKELDQRTLIGLIGKLPIEQHINTIMDYSLLWFIFLYEHYFTYGDLDFLRRIYPMACEMLKFCESRINGDGFIEGVDNDWTFIDWSPIDKCGAVCAEQMLLIQAYVSMANISKAINKGDFEALLKKSEDLKARVNKYYWNDEKGAFIDSYKSGKNNVTRHANIFAVMYDIATNEQAQSILENVLKNDNVTKITTPYFEGYELDALAKLGDYKAVEDMITSYWGGMIELGATTIWEEYNPKMKGIEHYEMYGGKYEKSLCHAWGAGPICLFGKYYLGVQPTSFGYQTFTVNPKLGGLKKIKGTVPINGGTVSIEMDEKTICVTSTKSGGKFVLSGKEYILNPNQPLVIKR